MKAANAPWQAEFGRCGVLSDQEVQAPREIERRLGEEPGIDSAVRQRGAAAGEKPP